MCVCARVCARREPLFEGPDSRCKGLLTSFHLSASQPPTDTLTVASTSRPLTQTQRNISVRIQCTRTYARNKEIRLLAGGEAIRSFTNKTIKAEKNYKKSTFQRDTNVLTLLSQKSGTTGQTEN